MIDGVQYYPLRKIPDDRGVVMHMLKRSDKVYTKFGEVYFTSLYRNVIKAWHVHKRMDLNYVCVVGGVKVVLLDSRKKSKTKGKIEEYYLGEDNYFLLHIPHGVCNGMKGLADKLSIVANCASMEHDPGEMERVDLSEVAYEW